MLARPPPSRRLAAATLVAATVLAGATLSTCARAAPPNRPLHAPRTSLGVNLGDVNYYSSQIVFLDLVKQAQDWGLGAQGSPPPADAQGWPTRLAPGQEAGFMARAPAGGGPYVALYKGKGELRVGHGGRVTRTARGRVELQLDGGETHILIHATDPADPLRELQVVPAAHERDHATVLFDDAFLEAVRPFGVLRFMDWSRTNGSSQARWKDRPRPDEFSQGTGKGVALEYTLALCNAVRADCWLNVPHQADDEYVKGMAALVRDRLAPGLRAWVEYSNEIWNFSAQGDWCQREGEKLGMPKEWDTRLRYQAHRSVEIFRIFEQALGRERLVRVLAGQLWEQRLRMVVEWEDAWKQADAVAVAPYFCWDLAGDEHAPALRGLTGDQVATRCVEDVEKLRAPLRAALSVARRRGLPLVGYEGGQSLVSGGRFHGDTALQQALDQANRSPEMGRAYQRLLALWRDEGGTVLALYKLVNEPDKWGRWGLLERLDQPRGETPKYRAALEFSAANPPWWGPSPAAPR